ncbi:MAG: hypothetical protein K8T10_14335 [Candidatus Eremiobacteraeota bacterium]|nr:hypothetical protein [Candidatus Eremiobacteraeota bacterium]
MKKNYFLPLLIISIACMVIAWQAATSREKCFAVNTGIDNWEIDDAVKFHYAYMPQAQFFKGDRVKYDRPDSPSFSKSCKPDITNIQLKNILDLGFPLPTKKNPQDYKFFMKFFKYPSSLDPKLTAERVISPFLLYKMRSVRKIYVYLLNRENLYVKKGYIAPKDEKFSIKNPFPPLKIPVARVRKGKTMISPQAVFDASIPFSSIYITPRDRMPDNLSDGEMARWSVKGLTGFYEELLAVYKKSFIEVEGKESDKYYYFMEISHNVRRLNSPSQFVIIKYPKKLSVFSNFRNLPMPQDPDRIFLSGLLIVNRTIYTGKLNGENIGNIVVGSDEFKKNYKEVGKDLLEVGSVVKLNK